MNPKSPYNMNFVENIKIGVYNDVGKKIITLRFSTQ